MLQKRRPKANRSLLRVSVVAITMMLTCSTSADEAPESTKYLVPPTQNGIWYYEIGGADTLMLPAYNKARFRLDTGIDWNGNLMCSSLDPDISIENIMNGLKKGWGQLQRNVVTSVTGIVASLPGLLLHEVNPGLYNMINSGLLSGEGLFQVEMASCQKMTSDMMQRSPNYDWVQTSGFEQYRDFFFGEEGSSAPPPAKKADAGEVVKNMEKNVGTEGVTWFCGERRGGAGQKPIVMSEVVWAGYNLLIGRGPCETFAPTGNDQPSFVQYWSTPEKAQAWLQDVMGETEIYTDPNKPPKNMKVGAGLMLRIEDNASEISQNLTDIVHALRTNGLEPTLDELRTVSAPGTLVSKEVIFALSESGDQAMLIKRLAVDMASQREILHALEMRRTLYAAQMNNEINKNTSAMNIINGWIARLTQDVQLVREEMEMRRFLSQNTIPAILEAEYRRTTGGPR